MASISISGWSGSNGRVYTLSTSEASYDPINNTHKINWTVTSSGGGGYWYSAYLYASVGGQVVFNRSENVTDAMPSNTGSVSGTVTVTGNPNGTASAALYIEGYCYQHTVYTNSGTQSLTTIDRTLPTVSVTVGTIGTETIDITATADVNCNSWDYSVNGGSTWSTFSTTDGTSASTTITGLSLNTTYQLLVRARKTYNYLYGQTAAQSIKTLGYSVVDSATDIEFGQNAVIKWTPLDTTFKFKAKLSLGSWSYTTPSFFEPASLSQQTWNSYTLPLSVMEQLPNTATGSVTATIITYLADGTEIGSASRTFTADCPSTVIPTFTYVLQEGDTSGFNRYATGLSTLEAVLTTAGVYGSTVNAATMKINGVTYSGVVDNNSVTLETTTLMTAGLNTAVTLTIVDSRGRLATVTTSINIYEYFSPQLSALELDITGTTVTVDVTGLVASIDNVNTKFLTITKTRLSDSTTTTVMARASQPSYTIDKQVIETVSDIGSESYEYTATLEDTLSDVSIKQLTGVICVSRHAGGDGVAFGKEAHRAGLDVEFQNAYMRDVVMDSLEVDSIEYIMQEQYVALATLMASTFSTSVTYWVGQFVSHNGLIYECNTQHSGAWNANHFTQLT